MIRTGEPVGAGESGCACGHRHIVYEAIANDDCTNSDSWRCRDCQTLFWPAYVSEESAKQAKWAERNRWAKYCEAMAVLTDTNAARGSARAAFMSIAKTLREPDPTERETP